MRRLTSKGPRPSDMHFAEAPVATGGNYAVIYRDPYGAIVPVAVQRIQNDAEFRAYCKLHSLRLMPRSERRKRKARR